VDQLPEERLAPVLQLIRQDEAAERQQRAVCPPHASAGKASQSRHPDMQDDGSVNSKLQAQNDYSALVHRSAVDK
jgi:hypothetical protein